jgi:hypothetical protein
LAIEDRSHKVLIASGADKGTHTSRQGAAPLVQTYEIPKSVGLFFGHHCILLTKGGDLRLLGRNVANTYRITKPPESGPKDYLPPIAVVAFISGTACEIIVIRVRVCVCVADFNFVIDDRLS